MKIAIVTTTINVPVLLEAYIKNALKYKHKDVGFIVIGDKKTPPEAKTFCLKLARKFPYEMIFQDVNDQAVYLKQYPELAAHLPYNSIQRRNIGLLLAYEKGAQVIITIDDDNFFEAGDFIGRHSCVGKTASLDSVRSPDGWYNICETLKEERNIPFYHRGYAWKERWKPKIKTTVKKAKKKIMVNAGLWLEDPDVDALTRLTLSIRATGYNRKTNFTLAKGTWCPFNSQNTALHRDLLPAYFLSPLVGRYDDIWGSYLTRAIMDHMGDAIAYGFPLVRQERNIHNYWKDLDHERRGMDLTDYLCKTLRQIRLSGKDYHTCFIELCAKLKKSFNTLENPEDKNYLLNFIKGLEIWTQTMERVPGVKSSSKQRELVLR